MTYVILFVLGAIVGSFLNVVAIRWNSGMSLGGRSMCSHCAKMLKWYELVPVVSFILLRRRCRGCSTKISWQYPIIEILTGIVFLSIYSLQFTLLHTLILLVVFCFYIVILIYDLRHKIIPDELVYSAILLSILFVLFNLDTYTFLDLAAGPIIFGFFATVWLVTKGRALGFGDAKLGASVGLLLGASRGFSAIVLAFWIGAAVTLSYMLIDRLLLARLSRNPLLRGGKRLTMKSEIPFAPFIIFGAWVSLLFNLNLLHVSSF